MRQQALVLISFSLLLGGCGSAPRPEASKAPAAAPGPLDESRRFPVENRLSIKLVNDKVLGKDFLPGGNVAEYRHKGKTYRQFLVRAKSPEDAAVLLFDFKQVLKGANYLAHMGGYFGFDGDVPVYVFPKGSFLAGFAGLPEKDADLLARQFAARLN